MEQHPTGANDRRLAGQEIFCILLNKTFIATFSRPPKTRSYFEPIFCILLNKTFIATFSRPPKTRSYFEPIFCILLNKTFIATFSRPPKTRSYFEPIQHSPYTKFLLLQYQ